MADNITLTEASKVICDVYKSNNEFRDATIASALSALKELKGGYSDKEIATIITDRIFGREANGQNTGPCKDLHQTESDIHAEEQSIWRFV